MGERIYPHYQGACEDLNRARREGVPAHDAQGASLREQEQVHQMARLKGVGTQHVMCGCQAYSDTLPLSCIDDLQPGDCRLEGYKINLKML